MPSINFNRHDQLLEIVEKVNKGLKPYGIELEDSGVESEETAVYEVRVNEENQLGKLRELVRKAPLGYYQGRLIKHRNVNEQDVVNWLTNLHKILGL